MDRKKLLSKVKEIIKLAGKEMKNGIIDTIDSKSDSANIVTNMDVKIQKMLIEQLTPLISGAKFFAEEKENQQLDDQYTWVIDPIDGTTNYAYSFQHSCISIALVYQKQAIMGVCYDPYLDELFYALKGEGAYLNDKQIYAANNSLGNSLIMCGTSPYHKHFADKTFDIFKTLFLNCRDIRRSGSAVLDLCYLACGRVDGFFEARLSFWDYAAASLIVTEAKGTIYTPEANWGNLEAIEMIGTNQVNGKDLITLLKK